MSEKFAIPGILEAADRGPQLGRKGRDIGKLGCAFVVGTQAEVLSTGQNPMLGSNCL